MPRDHDCSDSLCPISSFSNSLPLKKKKLEISAKQDFSSLVTDFLQINF